MFLDNQKCHFYTSVIVVLRHHLDIVAFVKIIIHQILNIVLIVNLLWYRLAIKADLQTNNAYFLFFMLPCFSDLYGWVFQVVLPFFFIPHGLFFLIIEFKAEAKKDYMYDLQEGQFFQ